MIFVFGSNKAGIHGAGAAKTALHKYGAKWGLGEGHHGNSYALPTKGFNIEPISLTEINEAVDNFLLFAKNHPTWDFAVTRVGCGLGGHRDADIAPMFKIAPMNCYFDEFWKPWLHDHQQYWGTF